MPIPSAKNMMRPFLDSIKDGREYHISEIYEFLAERFNLSSDERNEYYPSGSDKVFNNRVRWTRQHLKDEHLISTPKRGYLKITEVGKNSSYEIIHPIFPDNENIDVPEPEPQSLLPEEVLESEYSKIVESQTSKILKLIKEQSPLFFEKLVVDLILKMGYGSSRKDAGKAIGQSGDEGIDGLINEDTLGLDVIYLQAKRWQNPVGRPEIQKFVGALEGKRARKGIFITTSDFTSQAINYTDNIDKKVILINGERLSRLMFDYGIGVTSNKSYDIKKIDIDYFSEDFI